MSSRAHFNTRLMQVKPPVTTQKSQPIAPPIVQTSSFSFETMNEMEPIYEGQGSGYTYSRGGNPTLHMLENLVADLEGTERGLSFGSGMGAIHAVVAGLCQAGDEILAPDSLYGGTAVLLGQVMPKLGVTTRFLPWHDLEAWENAITPKTRILWSESLGNPKLEVPQLLELSQLAEKAGAKLVVDSSFATPYLFRPIEHGADYVVHSLTKYLGGHGDLLGGMVVGSEADINALFMTATELGACISPFVAWLVLRGMRTLSLRMDRHTQNANAIAQFLSQCPEVTRVHHPSLPEHPDHERAKGLFPRGFGGMLSFEVDTTKIHTEKMIDHLSLFSRAASLGDFHSLVMQPTRSSHRGMTRDQLSQAAIHPALVRLSVGLEDVQDLIGDLKKAFVAAKR